MLHHTALALAIVGLVALFGGASATAADDAPDLTSPAGIKRALGEREDAVRLAAARAAQGVQDHILTAPLVRLLKDDRLPIREAALAALVDREAEKERKAAAKGVAALLEGLPREPDAEDLEREAFLVPALHDLAQEITIAKLLDFHGEAPGELIKARLRAVANVPSKKAIDALINVGSKQRRGRGRRTGYQDALQYATGLKLGADPDKWREWWRDAERDFDVKAAAQRRQETRDAGAARQERKEEARQRREEKRGERDEKRRGRRKPEEDA